MYPQLTEKMVLTAERQEILKNLVIDENHPGTILHDFKVLMDIVRESSQTLTAAYQLPLHLVSTVNVQLKNPIQLGLNRPQQKSYPHIHGLYLLVRASGLTYVDETGKKPVLVVDEDVYQQWLALNPTEQYGSLLEAWLVRGDSSILGERYRSPWLLPNNLDRILSFIARLPEGGLQIAGNNSPLAELKYAPEWHNLGLLDLFGLMWVQAGSPKPGLGWQIEQVELTPLGGAVLAVLYSTVYQDFFSTFEDEDEEENFGVLREMLQPYFPNWKNDLTMPSTSFRGGAHIFKVSLGSVWRRIAIDATQPLDGLASAILSSVNFDDDHLYQFSYRNRFGLWKNVHHPFMEEPPFTTEVMVGEVPLRVGQRMVFLFDFGDQWEFDVALEAVDPDQTLTSYKIVEKHGKSPRQYHW